MRGPARYATLLGRTLVAVGFLLMVLAWNGAAGVGFLQGQLPYLLSGSLPGLALVIIGAGTEYVQTMRQITAKRRQQMAEVNASMVKLVRVVGEHGGLKRAPDTDPAVLTVGTREPVAAAAAVTAAGATAGRSDPADQPVVAGRSSFHLPSCHLVSGRGGMDTTTRVEAEAQALAPCRVCKP